MLKHEEIKAYLSNMVRRAGNYITCTISHWFSFRFLIAMGILLLLQQHGAFEEYPFINELIAIIAGIFNWFYAIVVKAISWILSWPMFQWLASLI